MRKRLLFIISLLMITLSVFLGGCTKPNDNLSLEFDKTEINFTYGMDESEEVLLTINNASENTDILFTETTKGVVNIAKESAEDNSWIKLTLTPKGPGSTRIIAYNAVNSVVQTYFNVNVYQQISNIYEREGVSLYCELGNTLILSANSHFNVSPENANKADLVYEKIEESSTTDAVIGRETGVIDATNATKAGILNVKVYPWYNEELFYTISIKVLKNLEYENVTVLKDDVEFIERNIQLVKTKEEYSSTTLFFSVIKIENHLAEGTFIIENPTIVAVQKTDLTEFVIKSKELGETTITFYINMQGATSESFRPLVYVYTIEVIDIPVDINVNGESAKGKTLSMVIYNIYGENTLGQELRFTLSPSSVIAKYSDIILRFPVEAQEKIALYRSDGSAVDLSLGNLIIPADTTLYIAALPTVKTGSISISAEAAISSTYDDDNELVKTTMSFTIKQGLSKLMFDHADLLYMPAGESMLLNLAILDEEKDNADTSRISYSFDNDRSLIITKVNDLTYRVTAISAGVKTITFNSGNGHSATLNIVIYNPLTSLILETETIYENGSIGEKIYDGTSLQKVYVAVGTTFPVYALTNSGATIAKVFREKKSGDSVTINQNLVTVKSEGESVYEVTVTGYRHADTEELNEHPEAEMLEVSFTYSIKIEGYIPVSSISLSPLNASIYDSSSVGYYKVDSLAKLRLDAMVYPSSATNASALTWEVQGIEDYLYDFENFSGDDETSKIFTAKNFTNYLVEKATATIIVSITDHNRTYTQKCTITISLAQRIETITFSNVVGNTLTFDARKGLNTSVNSFKIESNIYPVDAVNTNLRYIVLDKDKNKVQDLSTAVFNVSADGIVTPLKGGIAYLRVAPEDSYTSANDPTRYVDILIKVLDGKSEETAYTISTVDELVQIGSSKSTMSLYYVLCDNIDISQSAYKDRWVPIGTRDKTEDCLPFVGQLSGRYTRLVPSVDGDVNKTRTIVSDYSIRNLVISEKVSVLLDEKSFGLFHSIGKSIDADGVENIEYYEGVPAVGTVKHLTIHVKDFTIDASQHVRNDELEIFGALNVYAGVIAGKNCVDAVVKLEDCEGYGLINNSIILDNFVYKVGQLDAAYIGGVVGFNAGIIKCDDTNINTVSGVDLVIIDKVMYGNSFLPMPQAYYFGGVAGYNTSYIIGCMVEDDGEQAKFATLYGKSGMMVTSNINSHTGKLDNRNNVLSDAAYIGGVVGYNTGDIMGVATDHEIYGLNGVGGIAGRNTGKISNCLVSGKVSGTYQVGGIVGVNAGEIIDCNVENYENSSRRGEATASILLDLPSFELKGLDSNARLGEIGGLVGRNDSNGKISYSYAMSYMYKRGISLAAMNSNSNYYAGDICIKLPEGVDEFIVGGLVGHNRGDIESCHTNYSIYVVIPSGFTNANDFMGSFAGQSSETKTKKSTIVDCYAKGKICYTDSTENTNPSYVENFVGSDNYSATAVRTSYAAIVSAYDEEGYATNYKSIVYSATGVKTIDALLNKTVLEAQGFDFAGKKWLYPQDTAIDVEEVYNIKANFNHGFPTILKDNKIISAEVPLHIDIEIEFNETDKVVGSTQILYYYTSADQETLKTLNVNEANIKNISDVISTTVFPKLGKVQRFTVTSSNNNVLQVSSDGKKLKIVGEGAATLTVTSMLDSTFTQTCSIYCTKPMNKFALYKGANTLSEANKITGTEEKPGSLNVRINQNTAISPKFEAYFNESILVEKNLNVGVRYIVDGSNGDPSRDFYFEGATIVPEGETEAQLTKINFTYVDGNYVCTIPYGQKTIITTTNAYINRVYKITAVPYIVANAGSNLVLDVLKQKVVFNLNVTRGATDIAFIGAQSAVISSGSSSTINVMLHSDDPDDRIVCTIYESNIIKNDLFVTDYIYGEKTVHMGGENGDLLIGVEQTFRIELKEKNKLISSQHTYQIIFASSLTAKIKTTFTLVINAQDVTLISMENFANGEIDYEGTTTGINQYNKYEVATNKIIPGRTGILKINTFPYFSYLDYVEVTGNDIHFEQIVRNDAIAETQYPYVYAGEYSTYLTNGIRFGNIYYDDTQNIANKIQIGLTGTYYAKTQLLANVKEGTVITITVKAYKKVNGVSQVVREQTQNFYVEYPPGVTLVYEGKTSASTSDQLFLAVGTTSELDIYVENSGNTDEVVLTSDNPYVKITNKNGKGIIQVLPTAVNGTNVTINAKVIKVVGGVELERTDSITFTIVDYIIKDIGFENVKNNRMNKIFGKEYMLKISLENSKVIYDQSNEKTKAKIQTLFDNLSSTAYSTWYGYKAKDGQDRIFDSSGFETTYYRISVLSNSTTFLVKGTKFDTQITDLKKIGATLKFYYNDTSKSWEFIKIGLNVNRSGITDGDLYYHEGYSNGRYTFTLNRIFTLDFYLAYSDENRIPIYNAQQFLEMKDNTDYILAEDIVLENFSGITTEVRSLDGNNKKITILNRLAPEVEEDTSGENTGDAEGTTPEEEVSIGEELKLGLFQTIPENGIYKNIRVAVENRLFVDAQNYKNVEFGLLAAENNGVIYNCSVEFVQSTSRNEKADAIVKTVVNGEQREFNYSYVTEYNYIRYENADETLASKIAAGERGLCVQVSVESLDGDMVQSNIGSLVGTNNGFITNSRVINNLPLHAYGNVGGLVAVNEGVISASYFNGRITNYSIVAETSSTGGLVAENGGRINTSYTEGKYIPSGATNSVLIEIQATTSAAGFVYRNSGEIKNCYSNLRISSQAPTAGFVYVNEGEIDTSYSTSLVQFNNLKSAAFVGVDAKNNSMNNGNVTNSYYLDIDNNYPVKESYVAKIDSYDEFINCDTYGNFAITQKTVWRCRECKEYVNVFGKFDKCLNTACNEVNSSEEVSIADSSDYVWNMATVSGKRKPTLVAPNKVIDLNMDEGTASNPYIIYSADTFNKLITLPVTGTVTQENDKYYALVSDISFDTSDLTTATYDMVFSGYIEGNGMNIENLRVSNTESDTTLQAIGLFSEVKNAVIKNVNIIPNEILGANIHYVGGLAGKIVTSKVFSVSVDANNVVVQGKNFVGGLAGIILGSNIQDVSVNISTNSTYRTGTSEYYAFERHETTSDDPDELGIVYKLGEIKQLSTLSYAGAVAGAALTHLYVDSSIVDPTDDDIVSVSNMIKGVTVSGQTKVIGEIVGGAIGYNGEGSTIKNIAILINEDQYLKANSVIGGVVGHNAGAVDYSYISHETKVQTEIDTDIMNALGTTSTKACRTYFRNLVLDKSYNTGRGFVIGGIVGINDGGSVRNSYSRVDIRNDNCLIAGGIIGNSSAGVVENCYSSSSIMIALPEVTQGKTEGEGETVTSTAYSFIGGIVGKVADGFVQHFVNKIISDKTSLSKGNKFVINSVVASNNWLAEDAKNLGYEIIINDKNVEVASPVYTSGTSQVAIPLTGGLVGALQSQNCVVTDDNTLNAYNAYVFKSPLPKGTAGDTPLEGKTRNIAEFGGICDELASGDDTTEISIIKEAANSIPYDICKMVSNGKYVETATSSYYENFKRDGKETEGYKNYVYKMFLLTNFEFENLSDPYPQLKSVITKKYTSYVGNVNGATGNVYDEEALFGSVLRTSQGDAYEVTSPYQLRCLAFIVNNNVIDTSNLSFTVTRNIKFSDDMYIPIGTYTDKKGINYGFKGRFLGNGYDISGMNYSGDYRYIGLFGHTDGAFISDLKPVLDVTNEGFAYEEAYDIGAIVAYAKDTSIVNCYADLGATITFISNNLNKGALSIGGIAGYVDGGSITKSYTKSDVKVYYGTTKGKGLNIGGLAGVANNCEIKNCYVDALNLTHTMGTADATNSPKNTVGGLVASADGTLISNTYAIINFTIGIGNIEKLVYELNDEQLTTYLKTGNLTLTSSDVYDVLSAFEIMGAGVGSAFNSEIYNSYFIGNLKNNNQVNVELYAANDFVNFAKTGGNIITVYPTAGTVPMERAVCQNVNSAIYGVQNSPSTSDTKKESWYSGNIWYDSLDYKWDFSPNTGVWSIPLNPDGSVEGNHPIISTVISEDGDAFNGRYGEYDRNNDVYLINTNEQLNNLATDISNGALRNGGLGYSFKLSPKEGEVVNYVLNNLSIGTFNNPFRGKFDGSGIVITINHERTTTTNTAIGLFGRCEGAIITNVVVTGHIKVTNQSGVLHVGSIIGLSKGGYIDGAVSNVTFDIDQQTDQYVYVGGLIGQSDNQVLTNSFYSLVYIDKELVLTDISTKVAEIQSLNAYDAFVAALNPNGDDTSSYSQAKNAIIINSSLRENHIRYGGLIGYIKNQSVLIKYNVTKANFEAMGGTPEHMGYLFGVLVESGFGQENIESNRYSNSTEFKANGFTVTTMKIIGSGNVESYSDRNLSLEARVAQNERYGVMLAAGDLSSGYVTQANFINFFQYDSVASSTSGAFTLQENINIGFAFGTEGKDNGDMDKPIPNMPSNLNGNYKTITFPNKEDVTFIDKIDNSITISNLTLIYEGGFDMTDIVSSILVKNLASTATLTLSNVKIVANVTVSGRQNTGTNFGAIVADNAGNIVFSNCTFEINYEYVAGQNSEVVIGGLVGNSLGSASFTNTTVTGTISLQQIAYNNIIDIGGFVGKNAGIVSITTSTSNVDVKVNGDIKSRLVIGNMVGTNVGQLSISDSEVTNGQDVSARLAQNSMLHMGGFVGLVEEADKEISIKGVYNTSSNGLRFDQKYQNLQDIPYGNVNIGTIIGSNRDYNSVTDFNNVYSISMITVSSISVMNIGGIIGDYTIGNNAAYTKTLENVICYTDINVRNRSVSKSILNAGGIFGRISLFSRSKTNNSSGCLTTHKNFRYSGQIDVSDYNSGYESSYTSTLNIGSYAGCIESISDGYAKHTIISGNFSLSLVADQNISNKFTNLYVGLYGYAHLDHLGSSNGGTMFEPTVLSINGVNSFIEIANADPTGCGYFVGNAAIASTNKGLLESLMMNVLLVASQDNSLVYNAIGAGTTSLTVTGATIYELGYVGNAIPNLIGSIGNSHTYMLIINNKATARMFFIVLEKCTSYSVGSNVRVVFRDTASEIAESYDYSQVRENSLNGQIVVEKEYGYDLIFDNSH